MLCGDKVDVERLHVCGQHNRCNCVSTRFSGFENRVFLSGFSKINNVCYFFFAEDFVVCGFVVLRLKVSKDRNSVQKKYAKNTKTHKNKRTV